MVLTGAEGSFKATGALRAQGGGRRLRWGYVFATYGSR